MNRKKGIIETITKKGYGFIMPDFGPPKVFFHASSLKNIAFNDLKERDRVEYESADGEKGPQANDVWRIEYETVEKAKGQRATDARGENYRFLNPYNFVGLPDVFSDPQTSPQNRVLLRCPPPPHDRFTGISGRITCRLENRSPLFISDSHGIACDEIGGKPHYTYRFFEFDGLPCLPASSLRGMIRSVYETITVSCLSVLDGDKRLAYRPMGKAPKMIPGIVKKLASKGVKGKIMLCKEAVAGAYPGCKYKIVIKPGWITGQNCYFLKKQAKKNYYYATEAALNKEELSDPENGINGILRITGENIEKKKSERIFFDFDDKEANYAEFDLKSASDYNDILAQQKKEREAEASGYSSSSQKNVLSKGDLVYVELQNDKKTVANIASTKVPRIKYDTPIKTGVPENKLLICKRYNELCAACRMFGWVCPDASGVSTDEIAAHAGRLRFSHAELESDNGRYGQTPLAVLSSPKPTTASFYLLDNQGQPDSGVDYDSTGVRLRGRKFYRQHREIHIEEHSCQTKSGQNRSITGAFKHGAIFSFSIEFENLSKLELGALLFALELQPTWLHRLGYAKPFGFGAVQVTADRLEIIDWQDRFRSISPEAGLQQFDGGQLRAKIGSLTDAFSNTMDELYNGAFQMILKDLESLLGPPIDLPVHYPRPTRQLQEDRYQYEWFVGNKKRQKALGQKDPKKRLADPVALALAAEDTSGLPIIDKNGT